MPQNSFSFMSTERGATVWGFADHRLHLKRTMTTGKSNELFFFGRVPNYLFARHVVAGSIYEQK